MSADNWSVCPRCIARAKEEFDVECQRVASLYGKVPVEEFDTARAALTEPARQDFLTFREDWYWTGAEDGLIEGHYKGACSECGLTVEVDTSRRFWPEDEGHEAHP